MLNLVQQCQYRESNPITFAKLTIESRVGILQNTLHIEAVMRMQLLLDLCSSPLQLDSKRKVSICNSDVLISYATSDFVQEIQTNIVVIPTYLLHSWKCFLESYTTNTTNTRIQLVTNPLHLEHIETYAVNIIPDVYLKDLCVRINTQKMSIQRLVFDIIEAVVIPHQFLVGYKFLWICFHNETFNEHVVSLRMKAKGFMKSFFKQLIEQFPLTILENFIISIPEDPLRFQNVKRFEINPSATDADLIQGCPTLETRIHITNPTIVSSRTEALSNVTKHTRRSMTCIDDQIHVLHTTQSKEHRRMSLENRLENLEKKRSVYQSRIEHVSNRLCQNQQCGICLEEISNYTILKCCCNSYCFSCINTWLDIKQECPICKQKCVAASQILVLSTSHENSDDILEKNSVLRVIVAMLNILQDTTTLVHYQNPLLLHALKCNGLHYQMLTKQTKCIVSNIVIVNHDFLGFGVELKDIHNLMIIDNDSKTLEKQLLHMTNAKKMWVFHAAPASV